MTRAAFLLDTNILIYLIGGISPVLRDRVEQCEPGSLATSVLCIAEADVGLVGNPSAQAAFNLILDVVQPLPFDLAAARQFSAIPFRRGRTDRLIAAHALALGIPIVTNNERDFADVPGLKVENWTMA